MKGPKKWRDTIDPFSLPFNNFKLLEVIGYPYAVNDVFQVKGTYKEEEVETYIKVARQFGADIEITLLMEGYQSEGSCNWNYVKYYMILIYSYFYKIGKTDVKYKYYIKNVLLDYCKK